MAESDYTAPPAPAADTTAESPGYTAPAAPAAPVTDTTMDSPMSAGYTAPVRETDTPAPSTDAPSTDAPSTDAPSTDAPTSSEGQTVTTAAQVTPQGQDKAPGLALSAEDSAAQTQRVAAADELINMTPREGGQSGTTAGDARMAVLRQVAPQDRPSLVNLVYQGRKASGGNWDIAHDAFVDDDGDADSDENSPALLSSVAGEHIDVVVPTRRNLGQAGMFLNMAAPSGAITAEQQKEMSEAGISPATLHVAGSSYHFVNGEATPVKPEHADWLLKHKGYAFKKL